MNIFNINRRSFLKSTSSALALSLFGAYGIDILHSFETMRVGLIGCGWYGKSDLFRLIQVAPVEVVSICDVDKKMLDEAGKLISQRQKSGKAPRKYHDFRDMLAKKDLDLVIIGTPDHWHALNAIEAMDAGAHLYLQKPISVDILEGEAIYSAARKYNKRVQIGTQRRSTPHLIEAKKNIISTGMLGKVAHVEICCYYHMRFNGNPDVVDIPEHFDYEMWSGPAAVRPYDGLPHGRWRSYKEYGNGIVGDMCVHMLDTTRWLLELGWPKKVSSTGGIYVQKSSNATIPDTQTAIFEFEEVNVVWQHRTWGSPADPEYPWAVKIFGEKGTLKADVWKYEFIPVDSDEVIRGEVLFEKEQYPDDLTENRIELHAAPATRRHMLDLVNTIQNGGRPVADIEEGLISSASCILANMSLELGRPLAYDHHSRSIIGDEEATALLARDYRAPWAHPGKRV